MSVLQSTLIFFEKFFKKIVTFEKQYAIIEHIRKQGGNKLCTRRILSSFLFLSV